MANDLGTIGILVDVRGMPIVKDLSKELNNVAAAEKQVSAATQKVMADLQRAKGIMDLVKKSTEDTGVAFRRLSLQELQQASKQMQGFERALANTRRSMGQLGQATQQIGYQVGDFFVQIQSGTNAFVAFGQQATQLVGILPAFYKQLGMSVGSLIGISSVLGIVIPLVTAVGAAFMRTSSEAESGAQGVDTYTEALKSLTNEIQRNQEAFLQAKFGVETAGRAQALQQEVTLQKEIADSQTRILEIEQQLDSFRSGRGAAYINLALSGKKEELALEEENLAALQEKLQVIEAQNEAQDMLNGGLSVAAGIQQGLVYDKEVELKGAKELQKEHAAQLSYMGKTRQESDNFVQSLISAYTILANSRGVAAGLADEMARAASARQAALVGGGRSMTRGGPELDPYGFRAQLKKDEAAIVRVGGASRKLKGDLDEATKSAEALRKELESPLVSAVGSISDAFGDFVARGLRDFKGFVQSILNSFKNMIAQMIAMAVKNRIMLSLGIGGLTPGMAAAGQIAGIGNAGGMLGSFAGGGVAGSGFLGGFGAAMPSFLGGAGNGLFAVGANAAAAGGSIAATIGAVAAPLLAVAGIFSFFKKKTKELDSGLRITVNNMDALVETFRTVQTTRFFGLSKKVKTTVEAASAEVSDPVIKAVQDIQTQVIKAAEVFGIAESEFADFVYKFDVSLKGLTDEQKLQKINEELLKMGDAFASLSGHFTSMNELLAAAQQRYDIQTRLLELQGNAEELLRRNREAELAATHELNRGLLSLVYAMEDVQMATQKVNQAASNLRAAMDRELSAAQSGLDVARAQLEKAVQKRVQTIQAGFARIFANLEAQIESAQSKARQSREIFEILDDALRGRRPVSEATAFASRASAFSYVSGGGRDLERLKDALGVLSEPSEQFFGTFQDYARDFALTTNAIKDSAAVAEATMTADEEAVVLLERQLEQAKASELAQIAAVEKLLAVNEQVLTVEEAMVQYLAAQATYDQVQAQHAELIAQFPMLNESVLSVADAVAALSAAIAEQAKAQAALVAAQQKAAEEVTKPGTTSPTAAKITVVDSKYVSGFLGIDKPSWAKLSNGEIFYSKSGSGQAEVQSAIALAQARADELNKNIQGAVPGFAAGGMFEGGPRIVGENGPELEVTGPSRIYSNRDTASMFRDPNLASAVDGLRKEVSGMRSEQLQIQVEVSKNVKRIYDIERKWDTDGLPPERV